MSKSIPQVEADDIDDSAQSNKAVIERSRLFNKATQAKAGIGIVTICYNDMVAWPEDISLKMGVQMFKAGSEGYQNKGPYQPVVRIIKERDT